MDKPFDPTLKALVEVSPAAWLDLVGQRRAPATVIDADIATVAGAVDKVIRVQDTPEYLLHLDFHSGHDGPSVPRRVRLYNTVLDYRHDLLVRSVVVVLRPEADSPQLNGLYRRQFPGEEPHAVQRYHVVRVWQLPVEPLLTGGLGTLPLAPISAVPDAELPGVIRRMRQRLEGHRSGTRARDLWMATFLLLGLRHSADVARGLLRGVISMRESSTYQEILAEGLAEGQEKGRAEGAVNEAREFLLLWGESRFGPPPRQVVTALQGIRDLERLHVLRDRLPTAQDWRDLLEVPAARRKKPRGR